MGTRGRGMMRKGLLSLEICPGRAGALAGKGQGRLGTTLEMRGRIKMLVVMLVVMMTMVMVVMVMMMTFIVAQVSDCPVYCKTLIRKLIYFSTICRYSAPTNLALPT